MRDERVCETRHHARVEHAETRLVLPRHLIGWSQQVLHRQNSHRYQPCTYTLLDISLQPENLGSRIDLQTHAGSTFTPTTTTFQSIYQSINQSINQSSQF